RTKSHTPSEDASAAGSEPANCASVCHGDQWTPSSVPRCQRPLSEPRANTSARPVCADARTMRDDVAPSRRIQSGDHSPPANRRSSTPRAPPRPATRSSPAVRAVALPTVVDGDGGGGGGTYREQSVK